jgi:hypothetical protein
MVFVMETCYVTCEAGMNFVNISLFFTITKLAINQEIKSRDPYLQCWEKYTA